MVDRCDPSSEVPVDAFAHTADEIDDGGVAEPDDDDEHRHPLRGLRLMCICGALPEEQDRRQPYEFDIDIHADVVAATHDDVLNHTIDYGAVLARIEAVTERETFQLFERMSQRVGEAILEDERIVVVVEVRKPRPSVTQDLASSGTAHRHPMTTTGGAARARVEHG